MAKRIRKRTKALLNTEDLKPDPRNPRHIAPAAAIGLGASILEFGDLSGIVWNRRTGTLIAGHQRLEQIHKRWGHRPIEVVDAARELGMIRIDDAHCFVVRIVDWPEERQVAANVTANSDRIAGEFTTDVVAYLRDVETLLHDASPNLMQDLLLTDLLDDYLSEPTRLQSIDVKPPPAIRAYWATDNRASCSAVR